MKILFQLFGVAIFIFQLSYISTQTNSTSTSDNSESVAKTNETEPRQNSTLVIEVWQFLKNNRSIDIRDTIKTQDFGIHLRDMFNSQIPENTKERVIFDRLATYIVRDIKVDSFMVLDLDKYLKEDYLMEKLKSIYSEVMEELHKYTIEQKEKEQSEQKKKEREQGKDKDKPADEVVDLGDVSESEEDAASGGDL